MSPPASELLAALPEHLRERCLPRRGEGQTVGEFVLCWLHHALRADDNPVIDAALAAAGALDLPVLFYQGLGGAHPYNSDRHHRFILESARDLSADLADRGHRLWFHLPREPATRGPLGSLARRAALVVTELYPVPPFSGWYRQALAAGETPWWFVDAACVVPMTASRKRPDRAFVFRRRFEQEYEARVARAWPSPTSTARSFQGDPGFEAAGLAGDLGELIAGCEIDHLVGPVGHTPGGRRAAEARWQRFLAGGLGGYAARRNDAAEAFPRGVSRLSPYLHYGCIASARVARECARVGGRGPEKFLDELLIWRELAHHFCFRTPDPESLEALPAWARETLAAHAGDPRPALLDWETLARGRTGDRLWDLCQRSLLRQGELHNNVRMTWGKALLQWTDGPAQALAMLVDLNHRYALDGNDPNSYGGLLWALGQFDRPFKPGQPVLGTVRPRPTEAHARRLDLDAYEAKVTPPAGGRSLRCLVLGAGLSGLVAARALADHGHEVTVLEKARGPGGRMATRRDGPRRFDHGAQYFTVRDERFARYVAAWEAQGLVAPWEARVGVCEAGALRADSGRTRRYLGVPGMNAICRHLAAELDCRFGARVARVAAGGRPRVELADGEALEADVVLLTAPPAQAAELLDAPGLTLPPLPRLEPCWAVLAELDGPLFPAWDGLFVNDGPLSWIARQASRPGRPDSECWLLHAGPDFSRERLEADGEAVAAALLEAARALPGAAPAGAVTLTAHRWRYAMVPEPLERGALWFEAEGIGLGGDWCRGARVEGAFLSGAALAGRVLGSRLALGR